MEFFEKQFQLKKNGTNVRTEAIAGITTFVTMAYILFVNPLILSGANGMPAGGVYVATILAAVIGTLIMGLVANVPYAQAPGMGLNALFVTFVTMNSGFTWQQALAMVFICGIINILITVTQIRKMIIKAIPKSLQYAISGGIGLFIAYIGFKNAGFVSFYPDNNVAGQDIFGQTLTLFTHPHSQLALIGLVIITVLMVLKVKGAILIGIIATTLIGIPMGLTVLGASSYKVSDISQTFLALDIAGLFNDPSKLLLVITTIFAFSLSDTFDTIGTFIGTGRKSGIFDEKDETELFSGKGFKSKMDKALFADATATSIGALLGTSNTTTYVESAAGIGAGGKTGLTSVFTAIMFLICLVFAPIAGIVPGAATAPALIIVGILMMDSFGKIEWGNFDESAPAFFAAVGMPFLGGITNGIAVGFIFYVLIKVFKGKFKEVHPIMYITTLLFVLNFVITALPK